MAVVRAHESRPLDPPDVGVLKTELDALVERVRSASDDAGAVAAWPASSVDRLELLRELRSALLQKWPDNDRAGPLLTAMRAFQSVEDAMAASEAPAPLDGERPLGTFAYTVLGEVSHMLRSPLGAMVMLADTLANGPGGVESDVHKHRLRIIHRAALGLAVLSDDLFTLSREDHGLEPTSSFLISEILNDVADVVRPVCSARSTELIVRGLEGEPRSRRGMPRTLRQALVNLVLQAALRTRGDWVEISVDEPRAGAAVFSVSEPSADASAPDLFGVFRRHEESDDVTLSADALRMVTARELVRAMAAELEMTTEADRLTASFRLELPAAT